MLNIRSNIARNFRGLVHNVRTSDGRLCVLEEAGNQNAEKTVVFLPGALGSLKTDFQPQFADGSPFSKYRQICFEPAGYGRSRPPGRTWPTANFLQRDAEDVGFCLQQLGIESCRVILYCSRRFSGTFSVFLPKSYIFLPKSTFSVLRPLYFDHFTSGFLIGREA